MPDFLLRLVRGGAWINTATECQTAFRGCCDADLLGSDFGFRVVCLDQDNDHAIRLEEQAND